MKKLDIDEIPFAPPALILMLREFAPGREWHEVRKRIRTAFRDIREQSWAFESGNLSRSEPASANRFEIHPHGALNLLSGHGCMEPNCRIAAAERLARSLCLIADRVWLTDHLSTEVMTLGRATNDALDRLMEHAIVLAPLLPLIKAGIVRFRSPWIATCTACSKTFEKQVETTTHAVLSSFKKQIRLERKSSEDFFVHTGDMFEPQMVLRNASSNNWKGRSPRKLAETLIAREIRQILWIAREATFTRGTVFSNSRAALAGLLRCDGRLLSNNGELRVFEESRTLNIPWVSELKPEQVLQ